TLPIPSFNMDARFATFAVSLMLLVLVACGDTSPTAPAAGPGGCTAGATSQCACTDGRQGAQTCLADRAFGPCMCTGIQQGHDAGGIQSVEDSGGMQPIRDSAGMMPDRPTRDAAIDVASDATATSDAASAPFAGVPDPRDAILYQVNLRAFSDKGFQGVIDRLDQIQTLGVNVIYLMPVTPVGVLKSANSPYCVR